MVFSASLLAFLAFFLLLSSVTCQQEKFVCKRLVTDKPRCKVYNYRHPLCKKWDHSQCPPPHIIRDSSPCVTYKCVERKIEPNLAPKVASEGAEGTWPLLPPPLTTPRTTLTEELGEAETQQPALAIAGLESVKTDLASLRRVFGRDLLSIPLYLSYFFCCRNFSGKLASAKHLHSTYVRSSSAQYPQ